MSWRVTLGLCVAGALLLLLLVLTSDSYATGDVFLWLSYVAFIGVLVRGALQQRRDERSRDA